ncbi:MAG: 3-phosphoshikimate 1-carboxyvinyltransferase [Planctomycetales bacterium]|nr:3-phosphoshikimate 1-carboxyvinyltransferase [Planctomycetales bacterium]
MNDRIAIETCGPIRASIRPPGSKSLTNRALACAALASGRSTLTGALDSEDTRVMCESLRRLGIHVACDWDAATIVVDGCGGRIPVAEADLFVANSGTSIRFLAAMVSAARGRFRLDGIERMRQRPIGDLLAALNQLGARATSETGNDCPPVVIEASGLRGGTTRVRGDISSQFLSGLLMAVPYADSSVTIEVDGDLVSKPYVEMTLAVMRSFGVEVDAAEDLRRFSIAAPTAYTGRQYSIEPDASAASYFWAAAAISGGEVTVEGLTPDALQGDVAFCDCLRAMGCEVTASADGIMVRGGRLRGIDVDMNAISDTVQTLGAVALFAEGPTTITNVGHIRHKETDRIGDLARELRKFGATVDESSDGLRITPPESGLHGAEIETYNDHRMAMSLALVGLRTPGVVILNPRCTEKTYPRFFEDLRRVCGR